MRRRIVFILDWLGALVLLVLSLPLLYVIAHAFVRAMLDR
jgi:hypothetical protein